MKILKVIHGYPPYFNAGSEVYSQSLVNELRKKHAVAVFTRIENPFDKTFKVYKSEEDGVVFYRINMANSKDGYDHSEVNYEFEQVLKEFKPDVMHIGHLNHLSLGIVDVAYEYGIPMLYTLHDYWLMCPRGQFLQRNFSKYEFYEVCDRQDNIKCADKCYKMYWHNEEERRAYARWIGNRMRRVREIANKIDLFHAPSRYLMNRFISDFGIPKDKIFYLDYGFPADYLKPVNQDTNHREVFTFGYIGRIIPAKGLHLLIEAFKQITLPARLIIWGRMDTQTKFAMQQLANGSKNPIEFGGEYVNQNIAELVFAHVDCIVVPSIWAENSPLVIHEAQACKIPVITADYGGMKEYVKHLHNGLLFKFRDVEDLRDKMVFAIKNPQLMKELGKKGYLYSESGEIPSIEEHCKKLETIYEMLIKSKTFKSTNNLESKTTVNQ